MDHFYYGKHEFIKLLVVISAILNHLNLDVSPDKE
ncbi:hypothetical protein GFC29_2368 [Anoxybacillus sp. B7M1]|nr:hypothetical protein GFC28_3067 [Anoxybacillus sp. B2M1]ANB65346.1 hypothetical protein GFC29_2368 [Anoxybacillus sp. B7M1]KXG09058.1 hypothetical protein AT864_02742 [Anoxybacillus sp. P3H1B]MBB3908647.1 hypothetical protein [Anoxybacillus rupiensis]